MADRMPCGAETGCRQCGGPFPNKRCTAYCSQECSKAFETRHLWGWARAEALRRARPPGKDWWRHYPKCARCGRAEGDEEVHHIIPFRNSGHDRWWSCLNHQENLEVLCPACHSEATKAQNARSRAATAWRTRCMWAVKTPEERSAVQAWYLSLRWWVEGFEGAGRALGSSLTGEDCAALLRGSGRTTRPGCIAGKAGTDYPQKAFARVNARAKRMIKQSRGSRE